MELLRVFFNDTYDPRKKNPVQKGISKSDLMNTQSTSSVVGVTN
jgi:HJR/Mrr/RecB family endonuclease